MFRFNVSDEVTVIADQRTGKITIHELDFSADNLDGRYEVSFPPHGPNSHREWFIAADLMKTG